MAHRYADIEEHDPDADWSLPGWLYTDPEYFEVEMARVLRPSWQIVCHQSDIAKTGDFHTIDYLGESVIVIRGQDGQVRAFANVCRHRAMRLVEGPAGCAKKLVCPYHAWTYETDGRLSGVPMKSDYPALRLEDNGLAPLDVEIWRGFVFVRLEDNGGPSVAAMMAPYDQEIAPYRFEDMRCISPVRLRERQVNWKNVGDNYSDNLHIPVAHDGLTRLFGKSYAIEAQPWVDKMWMTASITCRRRIASIPSFGISPSFQTFNLYRLARTSTSIPLNSFEMALNQRRRGQPAHA